MPCKPVGRLVYRAILESGTSEVKVACINDLGPTEANAHLLKYDTVHGILPTNVAIHGDTIDAGQGPVRVTAEQDPAKLPWKELDIDVALECTGFFANKEAAASLFAKKPVHSSATSISSSFHGSFAGSCSAVTRTGP